MKIQSTINHHTIIYLDGNEIATAIDAYLVSQRIYVHGPRTITANGTLLRDVKGEVRSTNGTPEALILPADHEAPFWTDLRQIAQHQARTIYEPR
jgi:hypothetical protein